MIGKVTFYPAPPDGPKALTRVCLHVARLDGSGSTAGPVPVVDSDSLAYVGHTDGPVKLLQVSFMQRLHRVVCPPPPGVLAELEPLE